ncbi:unnamed protein product [Prunus armeniaca]
MMFPKFRTQSDIDWSMKLDNSDIGWSPKLDNSCSYEARSEMGWLLYCIVLSTGFLSKLTKLVLPRYCDVPEALDSIRYRLVHGIGQFRFV